MTLNLLLAPQPSEQRTLVFADPSGPAWPPAGRGCVEAVLAGLRSQLDVEEVMYPLPHETARRLVTPPSLVRGRHADMWNALSQAERDRVLLVAGPTAAYLAPVVGDDAKALVAVRDPRVVVPAWGAWRSVLGPFPELDEVPENAQSDEECDRWFDRIRGVTSQLQLVRATGVVDIAREVAAELGLGAKAASSMASVAASADCGWDEPRHHNGPTHWLDEAIYSFSRPPKQMHQRGRGKQRARKRRRQ